MQTGCIVSLVEVIGVSVVTGVLLLQNPVARVLPRGPCRNWRIECGKENHTGQTMGPLRIGVKEVSPHPIGPCSWSLPSGGQRLGAKRETE